MNNLEQILHIIKGIIINYYKLITGNSAGNINLNTTTATTGSWTAVQTISNNVIIASITIDGTVNTSWSTITQAQGTIIYGDITSITLSAGSVRLYGNNKITV